jgi:ceramide glucosyltransferase
MVNTLLILFIGASWIYWIVAWWWTKEFFHIPRQVDNNFTPAVSILKPVKGLDAQAYQNFESFCHQDYPEFELLFGVADPNDPVIPVIRRLQQNFPQLSIRLIITPYFIGTNRKASILYFLAAQAKYDVLVISDSDMRVNHDYLIRVVSPLSNDQVGLVTCPYRGGLPETFTARLEVLYIGVTFLPSVIVARKVLKMRFALGSTAVLRKRDLNDIGGFTSIADYLADDYQLGFQIACQGLRVVLSDYVVSTMLGATTFKEQWDRELRWLQCTRISRPWEYPGLLLSFSTPLSAILVLFSPLNFSHWIFIITSILLRWTIGWSVASYTNDLESRRWLVWLPVRDMLSALLWLVALIMRRIVWRGEEYILKSDGLLEPLQ